MTRTRTMRRALALVAAFGLVAGACGDDDEESAGTPTADDTGTGRRHRRTGRRHRRTGR